MAYKGNTNLDIFSLALYENMFNAWPSIRFLCQIKKRSKVKAKGC